MTAEPAEQRRYWAGDLAVTVTAPDQARVEGYLSGYLTGPAGTHDLPRYQVAVHPGRDALARVAAAAAGLPATLVEQVPGVVLSAAVTPGGARILTVAEDRLENAPGTWAASVSGTRVDLYVADPAHGPRHVLRVIRELMLRAYEDAGAVVFHAAGIDAGGQAVMICGPRSAGKTTTAAALLRQLGSRARLLSNDRLLACEDRQVIAVPLPVPVARGTIDAFPQLSRAVPAARRARPGEPALAALPIRFGTASKITFPAREFAAALGSGLAASSQVTAVIIPALTDTADPVTIRQAAPGEALAALSACCFTPADEFWRPWLGTRGRAEADLAAGAARRCRELAGAVPCITVRWGVRGSLGGFAEALAAIVGGAR